MQSTNHTSLITSHALHITFSRFHLPKHRYYNHTKFHVSNPRVDICILKSIKPTSALNSQTRDPTTDTSATDTPLLTTPIGQAEEESQRLLEWPALCKQVASFCTTPIAAQRAIRGQLPIGNTFHESQRLYNQTREASRSSIDFTGIYDLRRALDVASGDQSLHPLVLGAVVTTLHKMELLLHKLQEHPDNNIELLRIAGVIGDALPALREEIKRCIHVRCTWSPVHF